MLIHGWLINVFFFVYNVDYYTNIESKGSTGASNKVLFKIQNLNIDISSDSIKYLWKTKLY